MEQFNEKELRKKLEEKLLERTGNFSKKANWV